MVESVIKPFLVEVIIFSTLALLAVAFVRYKSRKMEEEENPQKEEK